MQNRYIGYIVAFVFSLCLLTSCKEDENINSTDATVSMGDPVCIVKESKGLFMVPVVVSGEQNGDIIVRVDVKAETENCKVDENFLVTSTCVTIPSTKKSVNIEIKAVDDRVINEDRKFSITIAEVKGAKIDQSGKTTLVTLLDNDDIPYDRMDGEWKVTVSNMLDDAQKQEWTTRLRTVIDENEDGYGSLITMSPWMMYDGETYDGVLDISHSLMFTYNASSQTATLTLKLGETMADGIILGGNDEEGLDLTDCTLRSAMPTQTSYTTTGNIIGTVNSEFNKITFNLPLMGLLYDKRNVPFSYWFYYTDIVMTR